MSLVVEVSHDTLRHNKLCSVQSSVSRKPAAFFAMQNIEGGRTIYTIQIRFNARYYGI